MLIQKRVDVWFFWRMYVDAANELLWSLNEPFFGGLSFGVENTYPPEPCFVLSAKYQPEACWEPAANIDDQLRNTAITGYWLAGSVPASGQSPVYVCSLFPHHTRCMQNILRQEKTCLNN